MRKYSKFIKIGIAILFFLCILLAFILIGNHVATKKIQQLSVITMSESDIMKLTKNTLSKCIEGGEWVCKEEKENYVNAHYPYSAPCTSFTCHPGSTDLGIHTFSKRISLNNLKHQFVNNEKSDFTIKIFITRNLLRRETTIITHALSMNGNLYNKSGPDLTSVNYSIKKRTINKDKTIFSQRIANKLVLNQ